MSQVTALGYLVFEVSDPDAWRPFLAEALGLEVGGGDVLTARHDDYRQRLVLQSGPADDLAAIGWEVADRAALDALADRLDKAGVSVTPASAEAARARRVAALIECRDPEGIPCEIFHGAERDDFEAGFVTGEQGMGHVVVRGGDLNVAEEFYCGLLGLRLSDRVDMKIRDRQLDVTFLHANPRHHSIALSGAPMPKRMHHFMLQVADLDGLGHAYDRCVKHGVAIAQTLGRHPNDRMVSFYAVTPSGFQVEIGWGARTIDDATWRIETYDRLSEWGHRPPG